MKKPKKKTVGELANEIIVSTEKDQNQGYITDDIDAFPRERLFAYVRGCLKNTERCARTMRAWLKKYGEL